MDHGAHAPPVVPAARLSMSSFRGGMPGSPRPIRTRTPETLGASCAVLGTTIFTLFGTPRASINRYNSLLSSHASKIDIVSSRQTWSSPR
eukprot:7034108-Prymnesium_polylepis.1